MLATLDLALPNGVEGVVSKSAVTQARQRLGVALWRGCSGEPPRAGAGRTRCVMPDSPENRAHFGAQAYASGKIASYPLVRAISLTAIPTHLVGDMVFGAYWQNEMLYAKTLFEGIPDNALTIFDRGFLSAEILLGLSLKGTQRH